MDIKPDLDWNEFFKYDEIHHFDIIYSQNWKAYNEAQTTEFSMFRIF